MSFDDVMLGVFMVVLIAAFAIATYPFKDLSDKDQDEDQ